MIIGRVKGQAGCQRTGSGFVLAKSCVDSAFIILKCDTALVVKS